MDDRIYEEDSSAVYDERRGRVQRGDDSESLLSGGSSTTKSIPESNCCCDPKRYGHLILVLALMCLLGFGSYFCYDNPGALQDNVKQDMEINSQTFMSLYAWYSWPNVILCFFGGFLLDRVFGIRVGTIIFATFVFIGQLIFASGALLNQFWLMEVGRFVFGIGGESLNVAQNTYAVSWYKGKILNMVFGFQLSFARVGSTVNFNVMKPMYEMVAQYYSGYTCLGITLMLASTTCLFSLLCAIVLGYFDYRAEKILNKKAGETGEVVQLKDARKFPLSFWMISIICLSYYVVIFPFIGLGIVFFQRKYEFTPSQASVVNSLVYIVSAAASPILGFCIDKTGRNIFWVFLGIVSTVGSHAMLAFTFLNPYIPMVAMGISYSILASALWPMVAIVIPEHQLGTAYGIMQSVQNLGLAVISIIAGLIVDSKGYLILEIFFLAWLCICMLTTIILWIVNGSTGGSLNLSVSQRLKKEREMEIAEHLEREKLLASGSMADITPQDLLQPRSEFSMRNRYLSKIGMPLPSHYDVTLSALIHRHGLK